jgi:hypothetical protein
MYLRENRYCRYLQVKAMVDAAVTGHTVISFVAVLCFVQKMAAATTANTTY